jgi:FHS family glucose/mannose:H+ symporter-like MFS transporter
MAPAYYLPPLAVAEVEINNSTISGRPALRVTILLIAFLLTGVGTALLGATLPVLLKQWGLSDRGGGFLLLLSWGGSTSGALLCRKSLRFSAAAGLMLTSIAMLILAALDRRSALPIFAFYGLGLGVAMTAITMISSRQASEDTRRRELMRLNLIWSIGACVSPTLAAHALRFTRAGGLFASMSIVFCIAAAAIWTRGKDAHDTFSDKLDNGPDALKVAPLPLYAMAGLAVGVESAIGGWLTTYAGRTAHTEFISLSATIAFWAGLLLSRGLHSVKGWRPLHSGPVLVVHAATVVVATVVLLAAPHTAAFLPSALLAGFGLGPLYPRVQALVVGTYKPRPVFIIAGLGAAALPWLTGTLSNATGSLRAGLVLPCLAAACLLALMLIARTNRPLRTTDGELDAPKSL